jgi:hypothetical protein
MNGLAAMGRVLAWGLQALGQGGVDPEEKPLSDPENGRGDASGAAGDAIRKSGLSQ